MARITHITVEASDPALDLQFEQALGEVRAKAPHKPPHIVGGARSSRGDVSERVDPANPLRTISLVTEAGADGVSDAVAAARQALYAWRNTSPGGRCKALRSAHPQIEARKIEIAAAVSAETGKSRLAALAEVEEALEMIEVYCGEVEARNGFVNQERELTPAERVETVLRPYGVFGVIVPFNFPVALSCNMVLAALAAGNTVVVKPAEDTPWCTTLVMEMLVDALPPGVLNVVQGGPGTGKAIVESDVDGIAFTGSVEVGKAISARMQEGPYVRPVIAEMGGNNPAIVCASADVSTAAMAVARSAFGMAGQMCSCCRRVLVAEELYDSFVDQLVAATKSLGIGDPMDRDAFLGPLINDRALELHEKGIALARRDGSILVGGGRPEVSTGYYVEPTILADLPAEHSLLRDEYFSPILAVVRTASFEEAIKEANAVDFGLTAGICTSDESEVDRFLDEIEAGILYVNRPTGATTGAWPGVQSYCGWKASGMSGKGGLNRWYVPQYTREQSRTIAV